MSLFDSASLVVTPNGVKEGKLYSIKPSDGSGDLSVTRATTATRVNSAGLVEVVPYNLLTYSEQFDNSAWTKSSGASITANSVIAPNGTMTADTLNVATATYSGIYQSLGSLSGQNTISIYAKKGTKDFLYFINLQGSTTVVWFNISNGTLGTVSSGYTATIENVGNGWYRCNLTQTVTSETTYFQLGLSDSNESVTPTSTGTAYIWGAQLNSGSAKDYLRTETRLNIPRLDYTNGSCPSILVEPQRTNLVTYSDNVALSLPIQANTTITSNTSISPDGTQNADNVLFGTSSYRLRVTSISALTNYTASLFFKNVDFASSEEFTLNLSDGVFGAITATIKPSNGTATFTRNTSGWSSVSGKIENYGNGWYRVSVSGTSIGGGSGWYEIGCNVSKNVLIFGMQLELGNYPTSYIPTTSASVTRNADVISKTGISSLIGQTEGTVLIDINYKVINGTSMFFSVRPSVSNKIEIFRDSQTIYGEIVGNSVSISLSKSSSPSGTYKIALAYKSGETVLYVNGTNVGTSTTAFSFSTSMADLFLGSRSGGTLIEQGFFNQATIWKTRLTNDQLAQLTTI